jgi:hypothetical protein
LPAKPTVPASTGGSAGASGNARPRAPVANAPTTPRTNTSAAAATPAAAPAPVAPARPAAPPALDLASLEQRLRETRAIGVFTKLSIKNQVDDLLNRFRALYKGEAKTPLPTLRQQYEMLFMKVLTVVQDGDPPLANAIASSREAIWGILSDPRKFAQI